jgi:DNA-binding NarL/FixJ family response regulator
MNIVETYYVATDRVRKEAPGSERALTIQLAVVHDEDLVREGITSLFKGDDHFKLVASVGRLGSVSDLAAFGLLDVVLLDVSTSFTARSAWIPEIQHRLPRTKIIVLDDVPRRFRIARLSQFSTAGYFTLSDSFAELVDMMQGVVRGEIRISRAAQPWLEISPEGWRMKTCHQSSSILQLTRRELEILRCFSDGCSVKSCAEKLGISPSTAENHRARIFKKLGVSKTIDMIRIAFLEGVIEH